MVPKVNDQFFTQLQLLDGQGDPLEVAVTEHSVAAVQVAGVTSDGTAFVGLTKPTISVADAGHIITALATLGLITDDT